MNHKDIAWQSDVVSFYIGKAIVIARDGLDKVLTLFAPHAGLLKKDKDASYKTGTLDGVRTLAGYANTSKHGRVRFVVALKSNDGELRFQLLKAIESEL